MFLCVMTVLQYCHAITTGRPIILRLHYDGLSIPFYSDTRLR